MIFTWTKYERFICLIMKIKETIRTKDRIIESITESDHLITGNINMTKVYKISVLMDFIITMMSERK